MNKVKARISFNIEFDYDEQLYKPTEDDIQEFIEYMRYEINSDESEESLRNQAILSTHLIQQHQEAKEYLYSEYFNISEISEDDIQVVLLD